MTLTPSKPASPTQVIVVEDDADFRLLFQSAISMAPELQLLAIAENGGSALQALQRLAPDVLLVDLGLPDMSGLEVIRFCRVTHPDCEVMVISVYGDERHIIQSIEAGATGYLLKDAMPEDLVAQILTLRNGGSPISPLIARRLLRSHWGAEPPVGAQLKALSERERTVLELVAKGFNFSEIAKLLDLSTHSVMTYVKRTYRKLQVNSKTEAVYEARKMGLLRG